MLESAPASRVNDELSIDVADSLQHVSASEWDSLVAPSYPFLRHAFLSGLEEYGCLGERFGWLPQHLLLRDVSGTLIGATPMYLKLNSYGEFVFDWSWAEAYQRAGLTYYPKLVSASPYTPATGPKLLLADQVNPHGREVLIRGGLELACRLGVSSAHWLFTSNAETEQLQAHGLLRRTGVQFHWRNAGYLDFQDFLSRFKSAKRKQVARERRRVREQGIRLQRLNGHTATEGDWVTFHALYEATFNKRGGIPTLSQAFFVALAERMPDNMLLVAAYDGPKMVAAAFCLVGSDSLYGRHWGCFAEYHSLHFEACYYQALEFCIENRLGLFEPGAQGEHKVRRGFMPTQTWSAHWLAEPKFAQAIARHLEYENAGVRDYLDEMQQHSPYRAQE